MIKALVCHQFGGAENLVFETIQPIQPASDEVLIEVDYAGVNFPDTLIIQGKYQFKPDLPFVPGQEVSGRVISVGADVDHVMQGDVVIASMTWGAFAGQAVAMGINTYLLPPSLSLEDGATILETYGTAMHGLKDRGAIKPGETLVVLGASGGTGSAAVQLGKLLGARVIAVASTEEKRGFSRKNGADEVVGYEGLKEKLKEFGGADVIFDPVGGAVSELAFRSLHAGGRHLVVGFASGEIPAIPFNLPLLKSASIVGVYWGGFWRSNPDDNRRNVQMLLNWFEQGKLKTAGTQCYPLEQGAKAIKDLMERKAIGRIVLKMN
ncbi:MAG: NADPH:quinone oxidoreductase family protein [Marinoscillum sp.]